MGTEHGWSCESAKPSWDRIWVVLAWLVGLLLTRVLTVIAAVFVTTGEPVISLELGVAFTGVFAKFTGSVTFVTHVMGGGNHNTGTAGMCTGDLVNGWCSFADSVDTQGDVMGTWGNFDIVDIGLPIFVIEWLIALPFLILEPLANLVLANWKVPKTGCFW